MLRPQDPFGGPQRQRQGRAGPAPRRDHRVIMLVPVAKGTDDVKAMFVLLTGIAVRDYFASRDRQAERDRAAEAATPDAA